MAMKAKHQRLVLAVLALIAVVGAGLLAASTLSEKASFFYTPVEMQREKPAPDRFVRLGGMVEKGSIKRAEDGVTITFTVKDKNARQKVRFTGIAPSLFVEGSGVVAEGRLRSDGVFIAENLLAKHDENYVPRELSDMDSEDMHETGESLDAKSGAAQ